MKSLMLAIGMASILIIPTAGLGSVSVCEERYEYTELSSGGFAASLLINWSDTDHMRYFRDGDEITHFSLARFCPFDREVRLCSISPMAPFLVPKKIPEDGIIELNYSDEESGQSANMTFEYDIKTNFNLLGLGVGEFINVNVSVETAGDVNWKADFLFIYEEQRGVLLFAPLTVIDEEVGHKVMNYAGILSSESGINKTCNP